MARHSVQRVYLAAAAQVHAKDIALVRRLIPREAAVCEWLSKNMQRFALKQDAFRIPRALLGEDERLAYEQASMLLVGKNVNSPRCKRGERKCDTPE